MRPGYGESVGMRRAMVAVVSVLLCAVPAAGGRASGPADHAAGAVVDAAAGAEVTLSCPDPGSDVDAFYMALTVTNADGPKVGKLNGLAVAAFSWGLEDVFVEVAAGGARAGHHVGGVVPFPRGSIAFEQAMPAAYASIVRYGIASWGAPYACVVAIDGTPVEPAPLEPGAARALRATDMGGGVGADSTAGDVSVGQGATVDADGYLVAVLLCGTGNASADGPNGERYTMTGSPLVPAVPITVAADTTGEWRFARETCADTFAPVLWTLVLPRSS